MFRGNVARGLSGRQAFDCLGADSRLGIVHRESVRVGLQSFSVDVFRCLFGRFSPLRFAQGDASCGLALGVRDKRCQSVEFVGFLIEVISEAPEALAVRGCREHHSAYVATRYNVTDFHAIALGVVSATAALSARELTRRYGWVGVVHPVGFVFLGRRVQDVPARDEEIARE